MKRKLKLFLIIVLVLLLGGVYAFLQTVEMPAPTRPVEKTLDNETFLK